MIIYIASSIFRKIGNERQFRRLGEHKFIDAPQLLLS